MSYILVLVIALAVFGFLFLSLKRAVSPEYRAIPFLLTKSELNFFKQLNRKLNENMPGMFQLNSKVRLADICTNTNKKDIASFNRISRKHVDFVITELSTSKVVCAIELDDRSHNSASAIKRDTQKNTALRSANITLIRIKNTRNYSKVINNSVMTELERYQANNGPEPIRTMEKKKDFLVSSCPKCRSTNMDKHEMKFPNRGEIYYECDSCSTRIYE